jgi:PTS system nitrogen regulatory IIA component
VRLDTLTRPELIFPDLPGTDVASVLRAFAERLAAAGFVEDSEALYCKLREREDLGSTGIGSGVAIPHCKIKGIDKVIVAIAISRSGVEFGSVDGKPVRLLFLVLSPAADPAAHLRSLAAISKWVKDDQHLERILASTDAEAIYGLLAQEGPE